MLRTIVSYELHVLYLFSYIYLFRIPKIIKTDRNFNLIYHHIDI